MVFSSQGPCGSGRGGKAGEGSIRKAGSASTLSPEIVGILIWQQGGIKTEEVKSHAILEDGQDLERSREAHVCTHCGSVPTNHVRR